VLQSLCPFSSSFFLSPLQFRYLDAVKKLDVYGATFFKANRLFKLANTPPQSMILCVSERGLIILDGVTKEGKFNYPLPDILTYVVSSFCFFSHFRGYLLDAVVALIVKGGCG
jgi:hypothetical protein